MGFSVTDGLVGIEVLCKQEEFSARRRRWKWSAIRRMRQKRLEYIDLYCKKKRSSKSALTATEEARFQQLEDRLEYETTLLFRSLAQKYLEKDQAYIASRKQEIAQSSGGQSWLGRVWSYVPGTGSDLSLQLTDDIMKEIYTEMDAQEEQPFQVANVPKEYVKTRVNFELQKGLLELRHGSGLPIASANFDGFHISLEKRLDSMSFSGNLESMGVTDHFTPDSKFPQLISQSHQIREDLSEGEDDEDAYFFSLMVDINPLDSIADYRLLLSTRPLNVILSKVFINRVVSFFNKPITQIRRRKMAEFNVRAYTRLQEIRQQTEDQLIQAMADRKVFDVQVHLSAPNVMVPKDFTDEHTPTLVLVLGTLSVSSDLRERQRAGGSSALELEDSDKTTATLEGFEELVRMANENERGEANAEKNFGYLYDKFYLSLTSLEAGVTRRAFIRLMR